MHPTQTSPPCHIQIYVFFHACPCAPAYLCVQSVFQTLPSPLLHYAGCLFDHCHSCFVVILIILIITTIIRAFGFDNSRFITPWITVADGQGTYLHRIEFTLTYSENDITDVKWTLECMYNLSYVVRVCTVSVWLRACVGGCACMINAWCTL